MSKYYGFTLVEILIVIAIIGILTSIGLVTFNSSQIKSRDAKRKAHLQQISSALELYYNDKGQYPADDASGNIMGCGAGAIAVCTWGTSAFSNTTTGTIYMTKLPADPHSYSYYYRRTATSSYQLYAHLENTQDKSILSTPPNLNCGTGANSCNYGVSSGNTTP